MHKTIFVALAIAAMTACGSESDEAVDTGFEWPVQCDASASEGLCYEWSGEQTADHADFQALCEDTYSGSYTNDFCPTEGLVGSCDTDQGFGLFLTYVYYDSDWDVDTARAHCEGLASCQFSCSFIEG